jgi:hypothetical protein
VVKIVKHIASLQILIAIGETKWKKIFLWLLKAFVGRPLPFSTSSCLSLKPCARHKGGHKATV